MTPGSGGEPARILGRGSGGGRSPIELSAEVLGELDGVRRDARDEAGAAAARDRPTHDIEPGNVGDAAVVGDLAAAVEQVGVEPGVVGSQTGGPHDGLE